MVFYSKRAQWLLKSNVELSGESVRGFQNLDFGWDRRQKLKETFCSEPPHRMILNLSLRLFAYSLGQNPSFENLPRIHQKLAHWI